MKASICYCILVHQDSEILRRMMAHLLEDLRSVVVVHVDRKSKGLADRLSNAYKARDRVQVHSFVKVRWGHYSMCQAMAACLKIGFAQWPGLDRFVFLSGQHYLLAPVAEINDFFERYRSAEFTEQYCMFTQRWIIYGMYKRRYSYYWPLPYMRGLFLHGVALMNKLCRVKRKIPNGDHPYSGSQWMSVTSTAARILLDSLDNPEISTFWSKSFIPDEMLFHTILGNSEVRTKIEKCNLNHISWNPNGTPRVFTIKDLDELHSARESGCFFTRKVDPAVSKELCQTLDQELSPIVSTAGSSNG